jgi:hypothetical protein
VSLCEFVWRDAEKPSNRNQWCWRITCNVPRAERSRNKRCKQRYDGLATLAAEAAFNQTTSLFARQEERVVFLRLAHCYACGPGDEVRSYSPRQFIALHCASSANIKCVSRTVSGFRSTQNNITISESCRQLRFRPGAPSAFAKASADKTSNDLSSVYLDMAAEVSFGGA